MSQQQLQQLQQLQQPKPETIMQGGQQLPSVAQAVIDNAVGFGNDIDTQVRDMICTALVHRATRETSRETASRIEDLAIRLRARANDI